MPKRTRDDGEAVISSEFLPASGAVVAGIARVFSPKTAFLQQLAANPIIQADAWERDDLYDDPSS